MNRRDFGNSLLLICLTPKLKPLEIKECTINTILDIYEVEWGELSVYNETPDIYITIIYTNGEKEYYLGNNKKWDTHKKYYNKPSVKLDKLAKKLTFYIQDCICEYKDIELVNKMPGHDKTQTRRTMYNGTSFI